MTVEVKMSVEIYKNISPWNCVPAQAFDDSQLITETFCKRFDLVCDLLTGIELTKLCQSVPVVA